jgi:hypothetical protein
VHSFDDQCMCGEVRCNTGCESFDRAEPADLCKLRIVGPGGISGNETNAILVEEGSQESWVCTRSTVAFNAAHAFADAVIIIAKEGETELVAAVDSKSAIAQSESLRLEHVNIPVGVVTNENGVCVSSTPS